MIFSHKKLPTVMNSLATLLNRNHNINFEVIIATIHRTPYKRGCKRGLIYYEYSLIK